MRYMTSLEIRNTWLKFFKSHGHLEEPSASLVPRDDKTLLWINAGVAPLKKYFDGRETPKSRRITNVQKCIRTNDIENVGKTARHHTFFEMMGNFSIGDYFKQEAIEFGFELLTSEDYFGMPKELLYITVYKDDLDTYNKWKSLGIDESHLIKLESNFWEIGEGPSGPDTEIFFDRGEIYDKRDPKLLLEGDLENDRLIEIWNIVFSQFNAEPGKKKRSEYNELPSKNIDTGAGLERFACVLQGVNTNYDTDLFMPIIKKIEEISGVKYDGQMAFKVISDHVRTVTFALSDGATFSNEGRGYVLRRVLRRASKYAKKLGINRPFMNELVDVVLDVMLLFYPYLEQNIKIVKQMINAEEEKFLSTIQTGELKLQDFLKEDGNMLTGKHAFLLYDTFGFPIELTEEYVSDQGKSVDLEGFKKEMDIQKQRARSARTKDNSMGSQNEEYLNFKEPSTFVGYDTLECESRVIKKFDNNIVLDKTPFYATSGGQTNDLGTINGFKVLDVFKLPNGQFLHVMEDNNIEEGEMVLASVDKVRRLLTMKNHSSAHLLQNALQRVLGNHVHQQGSYVSDNVCRFDFNNYTNLTDDNLLEIEKLVNIDIDNANPVNTLLLPIEEAKKLGAMALFGEKYGDIVRVVEMANSKEFCGGTHVKNTKDINHFAIFSCESIGSGTFRITAYTGTNTKEQLIKGLDNQIKDLDQIKEKINAVLAEFAEKKHQPQAKLNDNYNLFVDGYAYVLEFRKAVFAYKEYLKDLTKELNALKQNEGLQGLDAYDKFKNGNKMIFALNDFDTKNLKSLADALLNKIGTGLVFIANVVNNESLVFVCKQNIGLNAGTLVKEAAVLTGGNGGGRPDIAQAGGKDVSKLDLALNRIKELTK